MTNDCGRDDADDIARMETKSGRATYAERGNVIARNRGLRNFLGHGMSRCPSVLTLFALAHNVMRSVELLASRI